MNQNIRYPLASLFFLFICLIIYLADTGKEGFIFEFVDRIPYGDKLGHVVLYGILAALVNLALGFRSVRVRRFNMQLGALLVLGFALIEEMTQHALSHRTLSLADAIADLAGISLFTYLSLFLQKKSA